LHHEHFRLRDAAAVIAIELGYESWRALCQAHDDGGTTRWYESDHGMLDRAGREANARGDDWCGDEHLLLALLHPPEATIAKQVLDELGLRHEDVMARLGGPRRTRGDDALVVNPRFQICLALATGLALAEGVPLRDEHLLLTLVFVEHGETLSDHDLDPDEVYDALRRHGVSVPPLRPALAPTPLGPFGPRVYFPADDYAAVIDALSERYPPGGPQWGWNVSHWRPGQYWIDSEDEIDAAAIVRGAVADPSLVGVVAIEVAAPAEHLAALADNDEPDEDNTAE
jgi:hypothetical protein